MDTMIPSTALSGISLAVTEGWYGPVRGRIGRPTYRHGFVSMSAGRRATVDSRQIAP
ncbi:hypothetical protein [Streptomyces sp. NPDC093594]|uniref:hypothetical protein n=1 Tax=Streptomyces sp. NPDC093594 TaxID=3155305 RepID=UPI00344F9EB5